MELVKNHRDWARGGRVEDDAGSVRHRERGQCEVRRSVLNDWQRVGTAMAGEE